MRARRPRAGHPRVNCLVPGCKRGTTRLEPFPEGFRSLQHPDRTGLEWVCGPHWRRVPAYLRRRERRLVRRWEKLGGPEGYWKQPGGSPARLALLRLEKLIPRLWDRMVAIAKGEDEPAAGVPAGLAEELRRVAL